jgi:6-pyruvoyl-tetrahydropterin synthase
MQYIRKFTLQVAHFNDVAPDGKAVYPRLLRARLAEGLDEARALYEEILCGIHGHNLIVTVSCETEKCDEYVVDDPIVTKTITAFDNWNLSMHPGLGGARATTENICRLFGDALRDAGVFCRFNVHVEEREEIKAAQAWPAVRDA